MDCALQLARGSGLSGNLADLLRHEGFEAFNQLHSVYEFMKVRGAISGFEPPTMPRTVTAHDITRDRDFVASYEASIGMHVPAKTHREADHEQLHRHLEADSDLAMALANFTPVWLAVFRGIVPRRCCRPRSASGRRHVDGPVSSHLQPDCRHAQVWSSLSRALPTLMPMETRFHRVCSACSFDAGTGIRADAKWPICPMPSLHERRVTVCRVSELAHFDFGQCIMHLTFRTHATCVQAQAGLDVVLPLILGTERSVDQQAALSSLLNTLHGAIGQRIHRIPAAHDLFTLASQARAQ